MAIRTSINAAALAAQYRNFQAGRERAQDDLYALADPVEGVFEDLFKNLRREFLQFRLTLPNDDRWVEVEAVLYGALKSANPEFTSAFEAIEALGETADAA